MFTVCKLYITRSLQEHVHRVNQEVPVLTIIEVYDNGHNSLFTTHTLEIYLSGPPLQVIAVARTSDLVIMMVDVTKGEVQKELLTAELEAVGIRLNKRKPGIYFKVRRV